MNEEPNGERRVVRGLVKWFDPGKGFGFIVADEGGPDILLHANVLRNFGQSSISDGSVIEVIAGKSDRGLQAIEIVSVVAAVSDGHPPLSDLVDYDPEFLAQQPLQPARVKWFDKGKGFGFANIFGSDEDVFVHIEVLRRSGLADLQPGEAVCLKCIAGKRGQMAIEVQPWEYASSH